MKEGTKPKPIQLSQYLLLCTCYLNSPSIPNGVLFLPS